MNPEDLIYNEYNKTLYRNNTVSSGVSASALEPVNSELAPESLAGGSTIGDTAMTSGNLRSSNFVDGSAGWQLTPTSAQLNVSTAIASLDIPDTTTANSFHVENDGDTYWGAAAIGDATAKIEKTGAATFSNVTITGGAITGTPIASIPNNTSTDISLLEKTHNLVFSVTDANTIAWATGTIIFSNGRAFTIDAGNTGNMSALTYIYLDTAVSSTVLQTTTTYSTAMGANKSLLGMAKNNTVTATFIPYGAGQPLIDGADIGALSVVAGNIASSTIDNTKIDTGSFIATPSDENLVGYWSFDEGSGTQVKDTSKNTNHGTITGATFADGVSGKALSFDGIDDLVDNSTAANLTYNNFSISWWMKRSATRYENIFSINANGINGQIEVDKAANAIRFESYTNNIYQKEVMTTGLDLTDGLWHHFVLVSSPTEFCLYSDGVKTYTTTPNTDTADQQFRYIGRQQLQTPSTYGNWFTGQLDEVRFYNTALSLKEVQALYLYINPSAKNVITAQRIASKSITAAEITAGTITTDEIAAATIVAGNIAANTITSSEIAANTITASQIAAGTITTTEIAALTIVAGNIAASTITSNKMSVSQLSAIAADMGTVTAGSININSGVASISSAGAAVFKSIQVGGSSVQYTLNDSGIFSFGDGSDGDATITGNTTLTADKYYDNLTVNNGAVLNPGGYRIFVKGTLTLSGNGSIARNGNNAVSTTGGAALADGYLKGSLAGTNGTAGATNSSAVDADDGAATTNSLGSNGSTGGTGGASGTGYRNPGAGGTGGTRTLANTKLIANWHLATLLDVGSTGATVKYDNSGGAGGGGGGGSSFDSPIANGGAGGGAGSHGGIVAIYAKIISIASGSSITANGGAGANGAPGDTGVNVGGGGGGGGAGGNGGIIILVYNQLTNNGSITVTAGAKGTGGAAGGGTTPGLPGNDGTIGSAGTIYQFQLSL